MNAIMQPVTTVYFLFTFVVAVYIKTRCLVFLKRKAMSKRVAKDLVFAGKFRLYGVGVLIFSNDAVIIYVSRNTLGSQSFMKVFFFSCCLPQLRTQENVYKYLKLIPNVSSSFFFFTSRLFFFLKSRFSFVYIS